MDDHNSLRARAYANFMLGVGLLVDEPDFDIFVQHAAQVYFGSCNEEAIHLAYQDMLLLSDISGIPNGDSFNGYCHSYHVLLGGHNVEDDMALLQQAAEDRNFECHDGDADERWIRFFADPGRFEEFRALMLESADRLNIVITRIVFGGWDGDNLDGEIFQAAPGDPTAPQQVHYAPVAETQRNAKVARKS